MDESFALLKKGNILVLTTRYEVTDIDTKRHIITVRNMCNGEEFTGTDWWLYSMRQQGFQILIEGKVS